ncbi:MarR family transcriptional regulator [Psychrosphaera sp. B3R10]|uniref:MarR family transcriptional regulator n=1 Tax=Psychrosphaera algicola TaxID=3023714 RepID=A0ABT5FHH8_9GAMM|nr:MULTISPECIES: MarR family transcriptional regulator [unclassified Psychrosphaera]MBU2880485.1 MarR family transcriptional regulator [Psychrosphaera sp. I2R16]MBU2991414.1 MarR family transcriptional regulator [Psychrosphaera sp. B3R10]MDC2890646.1 MarR family transcriptional regulator [Psychrosphaera sp. G1-22]MDO6720295.1 MarR family transcriptional regulator [Psychrosphaera sp. 1_MG-2023]
MNSKKIVTLMLEQGYVSTLLNKRLDGGLSVHGISTTEFVIMHKLASSATGNMSRIALADAVGLTASGVTRLLAPMEKNNITEKLANPRDARQSLVGLSDVGRTLYNDAYVTFVHSCTSAFSLLDESEIDMLLHLLNKIKC